MRLVSKNPGKNRALNLVGAPLFAAASVTAPAVLPISPLIPTASASCPGAEVVFARGREEPPGLGAVGDTLVNDLRGKTRLSVGAYGVNYPANISVDTGANDIGAHVRSMAQSCPDTREVIGGYSLGAEAVDVAMFSRLGGVEQRIAAVALFGNGTHGTPPAFAGKTIDQCAQHDFICGSKIGGSWPAHLQPSYIDSGLVDQAAAFVAGKL